MGSLLGKGGSIHDAARTGDSKKLMEILSKQSERINEKDDFGNTPLHVAVDKGHIGIIKYLLSKGADTNARDNDGRTPFYYMDMRPNEEIEELLRNHGAK